MIISKMLVPLQIGKLATYPKLGGNETAILANHGHTSAINV